jgi:hypothetical protein
VARIKVDIDRARLPVGYDEQIRWMMATMRWPVRWVSYYRTAKGWHVEIDIAKRIHPWRVIAIQAALGSDFRRETFNLRRTSRWSELPEVARDHWNVLFTRKINIRF